MDLILKKSLKKVYDLKKNNYVIGEQGEDGYFIYSVDLKKIVEYSNKASSPYLNYNRNLIYSGPGEYFVENDDTYYSILENVEYQKNRVSKVPAISTYSRLNSESKNLQGRSVTLSQYKVKHDEFFTSDCYENCGYFNGGYCGFIGLGLLIGCQDKYHNDDIMDDEYLSKVEWDQGSMMSGAWYKTKKNKEDTYQELANQGVTKLDVYYPDYQFIQINNKGMYSLKMEYEKNILLLIFMR